MDIAGKDSLVELHLTLTDEGMVSDVWIDKGYAHLGTESVTVEEIIGRLT